MQKDNKFFDDFAKLASGAAGGLLEMRRELEAQMSAQVEKLLGKMHLPTQEEVQTLHAMMAKILENQENLKKRLDALEGMNR